METSNGTGTGKVVPTMAYVVGTLLIVAYLIALGFQFFDVELENKEWARRLELFNSLEAFAFAAAGVILGTTVQRQVTTKAEERADQNEVAAKKGAALEATIEAKQKKEQPKQVAQELAELADVAKKVEAEKTHAT